MHGIKMFAGKLATEMHLTEVSTWKALLLGWIAIYIRNYLAGDALFILVMFFLLVTSALLSAIATIRERKFSSAWFDKFTQKFVIILAGVFSIHLGHMYFQVQNPAVGSIFAFLDGVAYSYIVIAEIIAIQEAASRLGVNVLPTPVVLKLKVWGAKLWSAKADTTLTSKTE